MISRPKAYLGICLSCLSHQVGSGRDADGLDFVNGDKSRMNIIQKTGDRHWILILKEWEKINGLRYEGFQTKQISIRKGGHEFSFEEHLRGLIYSLLSNQAVWARIEPHLAEVDNLFFGYNIEKIASHSPEYFYEGLCRIRCNSRFTKRQMDALPYDIKIMRDICQKYGSLDRFVVSDIPRRVVDIISGSYRYKLKQIGPALAYEYLRNVGIDCIKPDVHMTTFFGSERMGFSKQSVASMDETLAAAETISKETGLSLYEVDNIIWSFCATGYGNVCGERPNCSKCPITEYCNM